MITCFILIYLIRFYLYSAHLQQITCVLVIKSFFYSYNSAKFEITIKNNRLWTSLFKK